MAKAVYDVTSKRVVVLTAVDDSLAQRSSETVGTTAAFLAIR